MAVFKDITGMCVNTLTVDKYLGSSKWQCTCTVCGQVMTRKGNHLRTGIAKCKCQRYVKGRPSARRVDLVGKQFGRLTVTAYVGNNSWRCECMCGHAVVVKGVNLRCGKTTSCGCWHVEKLRSPRVDLTGQMFGDLTVLTYVGSSRWKCICTCGQTVELHVSKLKRQRRCTHFGTSMQEKEINDLVRRLAHGQVLAHKRMFAGKEADIVVPDASLAVEVNGSATHASVNGAYRNFPADYHLRKYRAAVDQGVHLVQIFNVNYDLRRQAVVAYLQYLIDGAADDDLDAYVVTSVSSTAAAVFFNVWSPSLDASAGEASLALVHDDLTAAVLSGVVNNNCFRVTGYAAAYSVSWVDAARLLTRTIKLPITWPVDLDWFTDRQLTAMGFMNTGIHHQRSYFSRDDKLLTTDQARKLTAVGKRVCTVYRTGVDVYMKR